MKKRLTRTSKRQHINESNKTKRKINDLIQIIFLFYTITEITIPVIVGWALIYVYRFSDFQSIGGFIVALGIFIFFHHALEIALDENRAIPSGNKKYYFEYTLMMVAYILKIIINNILH